MTVRDATQRDFASIDRIHRAMGNDYRMPDLAHPLFLVGKVAETEHGVLAACFLRLTAETYLWLDPSLTPRDKMRCMLELQPQVLSEAWQKGLDDVEARIPETTERRFQKRLTQLGWTKNRPGWAPWSVATHAR
jgi:hypothetical protein